jgi:hypothetical protein
MNKDFAYAYAELVKADKHDDGTMTVYGKATDDTLDLDQQICDPTWLDTAMPQWFKSGGNIREMHTSIAAGVAKEYEKKNDGHYISALVVDPLSVKKVENGVLKGFSIGIKSPRVVRDTKAVNGRIVDGQIIEVSLVDRPANPAAKLIMAKSVEGESSLVQVEELHEYKAPTPTDVFKREFSDEQRERMADAGTAMPDGSYPIANKEDLKNAIQAFGRAKNPAKVKQHIIRRARALGATDLLPEKWNKSMNKAEKLIERAKSVGSELSKFDQATFDAARTAIAQLFIVEANELANGEDERDSFEHLLDALDGLMDWYENEADEGEVPGMDANMIELGSKADVVKSEEDSCDCEDCADKCDKDCKCFKSESVDADKSVETPAEEVAVEETPAVVEEKSADAEVVVEETTEENKDSDVATSEATSIEEVVAEAVKSAMESLKAEIDSLRADKEAATEKSVKLEAELATALTKTVAGGPKRTATKQPTQSNEYLVKAATFKAKAEATTDATLRKGYMALYEEASAKANQPVEDVE